MKIKLVSDLHVDCQKDLGRSLIKDIAADDHDVLIVAGDVCEVQDGDLYFDTFEAISQRFNKVLVIPGNHEFWGADPRVTDKVIDDVLGQFNNVVRLKCREAQHINGHRFVGDTMWYPDSGQTLEQKYFSDFMMIPSHKDFVFKENNKFVAMFDDFIQKDDIIVTHHLPSYKLVNKKYKGLIENQFFVTEMEPCMTKTEPRAWFFGHTHHKTEMNIGKTFCAANPHGYPSEYCSMYFDEKYVIEI